MLSKLVDSDWDSSSVVAGPAICLVTVLTEPGNLAPPSSAACISELQAEINQLRSTCGPTTPIPPTAGL